MVEANASNVTVKPDDSIINRATQIAHQEGALAANEQPTVVIYKEIHIHHHHYANSMPEEQPVVQAAPVVPETPIFVAPDAPSSGLKLPQISSAAMIGMELEEFKSTLMHELRLQAQNDNKAPWA